MSRLELIKGNCLQPPSELFCIWPCSRLRCFESSNTGRARKILPIPRSCADTLGCGLLLAVWSLIMLMASPTFLSCCSGRAAMGPIGRLMDAWDATQGAWRYSVQICHLIYFIVTGKFNRWLHFQCGGGPG